MTNVNYSSLDISLLLLAGVSNILLKIKSFPDEVQIAQLMRKIITVKNGTCSCCRNISKVSNGQSWAIIIPIAKEKLKNKCSS
jgi:hypothetical protein